MRIKGIFSKRVPLEEQRTGQENDDEVIQQSPVFQDHHHDLLCPAPILPPPVVSYEGEEGNGDSSENELREEDGDFPDLLAVMSSEDSNESIVRLARELHQSTSTAPMNPSFTRAKSEQETIDCAQSEQSEASLVRPISRPLVCKGFPPSPDEDPEIPFASAILVHHDGNNRSNTFPPVYDLGGTPFSGDSNVAEPLAQCVFLQPDTSRVEHVVIDGSLTHDAAHAQDNTSQPPRQQPVALNHSVRRLLYDTCRSSRRVCDKALRIAREQLKLKHPLLQNATQRSASFARQASTTVRDKYPHVKHQTVSTVRCVGKTMKDSSIKAYHSVKEWESRHQVSQQVAQGAKQGWKQSKRAVSRSFRSVT
jgi:hypothetical protein